MSKMIFHLKSAQVSVSLLLAIFFLAQRASTSIKVIFKVVNEGHRICYIVGVNAQIPHRIHLLLSLSGESPPELESGRWTGVYFSENTIPLETIQSISPPVLARYTAVYSTATQASTKQRQPTFPGSGGILGLTELRVFGVDPGWYSSI